MRRNCAIKKNAVDFTNKGKTFTSGDYIKGHVVLHLENEARISHLYIMFQGGTHVFWREGKKMHFGGETYFEEKTEFIPTDECMVMSPGMYMYPFTFQFPERIMPSSFKGGSGSVTYVLHAYLVQPGRYIEHLMEEINFRPKLDHCSVHLTAMQQPQSGKEEKKMSVFTSGNISFEVLVDKKGYMPGESIRVKTIIDNSSSRDLTPKFKLERKVTCTSSNGATHKDRLDVFKEVGSPVPSTQHQTVTKEFKIPQDTAPTNVISKNVKVVYTLKVYIDIPYASDPEVKIPIFILPLDEQGPLVSALALMAFGQEHNSYQADPNAEAISQPSTSISNPSASHHPDPVPELLVCPQPSMPLNASNQQPALQSDQETGGPVPAASSLYPAIPVSDFLSSPSAPQDVPGATQDSLPNQSTPEQLSPGPGNTPTQS